MADINQMEFQSLRELTGSSLLKAAKCRFYAQQAKDSQLKNMMQEQAREAEQTARTLVQFLSG